MAAATTEVVIPVKKLYDFIFRCMTAVGTKSSHAEPLANVLVAADNRGHYSHGLNRLGNFVCLFVLYQSIYDIHTLTQ